MSGAGKGDEHWLRVSFDLARQAATRGDQAYGAVLVDASGNMLGEGRNTIVTGGDCTMHAELNLVRGLSHVPAATLSTATLYASTEPCAMCAGAIYWSGVGRLVFGLGNVRLYGEVLAGSPEALRLGCRDVFLSGKRPVAVVGPLLEDEAAGVVAAWAHGRAGR